MNTLRPLSTVHYSLITLLTLLLLAPQVQADPPVMSGLTVWLDATDLNGDGNLANNPAAETAVGQWDNKASGYSALDAIQTTAGYKPKMFRDATTGRDVVRFQRAGLAGFDYARYLKFDSTSIGPLMNTTNTVFVVARANMGQSDLVNNVQAAVLGRKGWGDAPINFSGYPFATAVGSQQRCTTDGNPNNTYFLSSGIANNHDALIVISSITRGKAGSGTGPSTNQMWKRDWTGTTTAGPVSVAAALWDHSNSGGNANQLFVGATTDPPNTWINSFEGDIGEILIYNRALSEAERGQVENYLAGRWITDYSTLLPVTVPAGASRVRDVQVDSSATNYTHVFVTTGPYSFVVNKRIDIEYLLVAGGGGGGSAHNSGSGGGGGGGVLTNGPGNKLTLAAGTYTITVGSGGGGGTNSGGLGMNGFNGGNSSITNAGGSVSVIAKGGGGGGGAYMNDGSSGASGGGAAYFSVPGTNNAPGQGKDGGKGYPPSWYAGIDDTQSAGGGGGGYGGVGQAATLSKGGDGGVGVTNSLTGFALPYAGGGGGGKRSSGAVGNGKDGGGNGVKGAPTVGAANTGGGGGGNGALSTPANGAAGGSGIVIIKYALPGPPKGTMLLLR